MPIFCTLESLFFPGYFYILFIHEALEFAVEKEMLNKNPAKKVRPPEQPRKMVDIWSVEEIKIFLEVAKANRFYALFPP